LTEVYIKTDFKEVGCEDVDCIDLDEIAGCCEDATRPLGYINDRKFLGELSYC
jgi:hypothetical protein